MLTLLVQFADEVSAFNVFRYITFRTGGALITSALIVFICGPAIIASLRVRQGKGQPIRADGPQTHFKKAGTPTMGGLMILSGIIGSSLLWANIFSVYVWVVLLVALGFGAIGFYDDYLKVTKQSHLGLSGRARLGIEFVIAGIAAWFIMRAGQEPFSSSLTFPFIKDLLINLGWFFIPFACVVIVGAGNAVNLTDGLDGLAISVFGIAAAAFTALAYVSTHREFANYLQLVRLDSAAAELTIFCGALVGASLGFLWWNSYPAEIFMGDVGSLALGGALGTVALLIKQEFLLIIVGGVFVLEALSVIIQVGSFKSTGKRVFKMAPLHHHFELSGWSEPKVIARFLIVAIVFALFSLTTLKLR
jgi:phospho-N-acetylmuramoyl-pentapeptide-transferase